MLRHPLMKRSLIHELPRIRMETIVLIPAVAPKHPCVVTLAAIVVMAVIVVVVAVVIVVVVHGDQE